VPVVLLLAALILVAGVFAANWDESEAADGPRAAGDPSAGVDVELTGGHHYFIFVRTADPAPTGCSLAYGDQDAAPVPLTRTNSWSSTPPTGYRYGATFAAPLSGSAELTCQGAAGTVRIVPDDTSYGYIGVAFLIGLIIAAGGAVAFTIILVMRMGSAKRRRAAMAAPVGLYGPC
jgi:hypothetical protein